MPKGVRPYAQMLKSNIAKIMPGDGQRLSADEEDIAAKLFTRRDRVKMSDQLTKQESAVPGVVSGTRHADGRWHVTIFTT